MKHATRNAALAGLTILTLALPAAAHPGHGGEAGFAAGLLHPLTGPDHLLALVAVGLWSRQRQARCHVLVLPVVFLVLMALGASCAGMLAEEMLPALEMSIAATVLLLGGLAALALRVAPQLAVALVSVCGFVHGLAHGGELAGMASGAGYLAASALAMGLALCVAPGGRPRRIAGAAIGAAAPLPLLYLLAAIV
jgi:urease accessory protein